MLGHRVLHDDLAPGAAGRRAFRGVSRAAGVIALGLVVVAGCQVRRSFGPESTRQLRVVDTRRIVERPALSPVAWAPDGRRVGYSAGTGLWVSSVDGAERQIAQVGQATAVSWSKPLDLLAFIDQGSVWTIRPDGTEERRLNLPGVAVALAWAPESDRLAVILRGAVEGETRFELWLTNRDGGFARMVVRAPAGHAIHDLQWVPESLYLLYSLSASTGSPALVEAWRVRIAYPDHQRIALTAPARFLRLAPSGRLIAYLSGTEVEEGRGRILVSRLDGSGRFVLTPKAARYEALAWSPQGDKLAYAEMRSQADADIWIADADGSGLLRIFPYAKESSNPNSALSMAWGPDGRHLVVGTNTGSFTGPIWLITLTRR